MEIENKNLQNNSFRENRSDAHIQKLCKIKRNSGKKYDTQTGKILPKLFEIKIGTVGKTASKV